MKISLIQMNSIADKTANLAQARTLIEAVVALERPDWIGLPEVFDFMGGSLRDKFEAAETLPDGPAYRMMQELAARHNVCIHAGSMLEKVEGQDRLHNTTLVFGKTGAEIARYRKMHMFDVTTPDGQNYRESAAFKAGDSVVTYTCEDTTIGCAICYDLRFPELFRALADKGAQMIALPAAFTLQTGKDHWEVLCRARAIETQTWFCAPAQTGAHRVNNEPRFTFGHSLVADPWGQIVAMVPDGIGHVSARIDAARVQRVRDLIPVSHHRHASLKN
ncbi:MAG: carbon-nitrogen hydrolase family protein [Hyphomicrobiales bacterium]|nr:carbon-nitrogen hydrolase family protein [Hyphomicrobiales bacterium]MDE2115509.1 carbon-nitrogen hydrolase family protein [Hyphomicrobiales bacterium]